MKNNIEQFRTPHASRKIRNRCFRKRGFTALEALVSLSILTLIGIVFMTLYVNIIATSARARVNVNASMDAAQAIDRLGLTLREARRFEFMDNGTTGPASYQKNATTASNDNYFDSSIGTTDAEKIVTGIRIVHAAIRSDVSIKLPGGTTSMSGSNALVNPHVDGGSLEVYRSDETGVPKPKDGTYLWMRGNLNGTAIPTAPSAAPGIDGRPLVDGIVKWPGAVQFIQNGADGVQIKIVTGRSYNAVRYATSDGRTSDISKAEVAAVAAANVKLRNYGPNASKNASPRGKIQYNKVAP